MNVTIHEHERIDDLQINGYRIIQDPDRFCFGIDAVLLSDYAKAKPGDTVVDLCTGTGIVPILMAAKTKAERLIGVEIQHESAEMACRSVALNDLDERVTILEDDIKNISNHIRRGSVNVVTCNPPYMIDNHGLKNEADFKTIARHEVLCNLEDVVRIASGLLESGGNFYMIHRPFRLSEIFIMLTKYNLEPKRMRMVYPYVNKEPNMVLIEAKKGAKPRLTVEAPLIVYDEPGKYTDEIYRIYGEQWKD